MALTAELDSEGHRHARDVPPAENGVAPGHREQRGDRVGFPIGRFAHLVPPRLVGPVDDGERQIFLALELVIQRAACVAGLARHLLEDKVAVAVP